MSWRASFGTDFVIQMLDFEAAVVLDLIAYLRSFAFRDRRMARQLHRTVLIEGGTGATISTAIWPQDDIAKSRLTRGLEGRLSLYDHERRAKRTRLKARVGQGD